MFGNSFPKIQKQSTQLLGAVEYANCTSAER